MRHFSILPLLFASSVLFAQGGIVLHVYRAHIQRDGWGSSIDYDIIVRLYSDSTIQLCTYCRDFGFDRTGVSRTIFSGKATINNNNASINWLSCASAAVALKMPAVRDSNFITNNDSAFLPPTIFYKKTGQLEPANNLLPVLTEVDFEEVIVFESSLNHQFDIYSRFNKVWNNDAFAASLFHDFMDRLRATGN